MVIVTHEMAFARGVADKIVFMDDGVIVEQGTPEEVFGSTQQERTKQSGAHEAVPRAVQRKSIIKRAAGQPPVFVWRVRLTEPYRSGIIKTIPAADAREHRTSKMR